jgi:hypothetical protein
MRSGLVAIIALVFTDSTPLAWFVVPAQPADATPSSALIRHFFRGRTICLAARGQKRARPAFLPVELSRTVLAFVFNARRFNLSVASTP